MKPMKKLPRIILVAAVLAACSMSSSVLASGQSIMQLVEDAAGNLGGQLCDGTDFAACSPLGGKIQGSGAFQVQFGSNGGSVFKLDGALSGSMTCLDASIGQVLAGSFRAREGSGTFSFNNCP
jgi:hypothetical protein